MNVSQLLCYILNLNKTNKGGNKIEVTFLGYTSNLQKVWDIEIIRHSKITADGCLQLASAYSSEELSTFKKIDVLYWMNDNRSHLCQLYDFTDRIISEGYVTKYNLLVETADGWRT
jgi:hypothetical protein